MARIVCLLLCAATAAAFGQTADVVFRGGPIWTGDSARPRAEAVAIRNERIVSVGTEKTIAPLIGPGTRVIDLKGRLLIPGFIDNHTHFMSGGFQLLGLDLRQAKNESEFAALIRDRVTRYPGRWITGGNWDHDAWPGGKLPTKELIDSVSGTTPVFVDRYDGHMALANSVALRAAGITRATPDPPGGTVVKDPLTGEPTGVLKDEAMSMVYRLVPDPSDAERLEAAQTAFAEARRLGVTSIQDVSSSADVDLYRDLRKKGELTARMYCRLPIGMTDRLIAGGVTGRTGDEWVRTGALKAFADGSLGSSTALFFRPYDSDPSTRGLPSDIVLDGSLERWAMKADRAGLQLSIHAIGDSANRLVLRLFEKIAAANPKRDRRFRIEHAQHIDPADFEKFARLGVIASVQPYHAVDDGRWAEGRIGRVRCATTYPFRTFLSNRVALTFGSDWTVAPLNPLLGVAAAVTRRTTDGKNPGGWFPEQKVSVEEALTAYTLRSAFAAFEEAEKGSLTAGKLADCVVLSRDILAIPPEQIENVRVDLTMVGGKIVYQFDGMAELRASTPVKEAAGLFESWAEAQIAYRELPGMAIAVMYRGELLYSRGFGFANLESRMPMTPQTPFRIASITKTFTSTAVMQLRDRGKLRLDDPVSKHLSWFSYRNNFPGAEPVTIWDLLTHTSGLPRESAFPYWTDNQFPTREEMIAALKRQQNIYEPETKFHYSNLGMAILGEVVAAAAGESYEQAVTENILVPAGMTRTKVFYPAERRGEVATGYSRRFPGGKRIPSQYVDSKGIAPAANITSTVEDLGRYLAAHLGKPAVNGAPILKAATLREMHRMQWVTPGSQSGWGLGFSVGKGSERTTFGHGGWIGSTRSQILACPDEEIAVAVVVNADDGNPATFAERGMSLFAAAAAKAAPGGPPAAPADPAWRLYTGRYVDPDSAFTDVVFRGGKLVMIGFSFPPEENPAGAITELIPAGLHTFRISDGGTPGEFVVFEMGADGKVKRVKATENYLVPVVP